MIKWQRTEGGNISIFERGETFTHWIDIRDRDNTKVDPSTVSITIKDPCDFTLVSSGSMNWNAVGEFYYDYDTIESSATYGRYKVETKTTSATGQVATYHTEFYVMPWKLEKDVRQITGASEKKDISDDDLADLCWKAYKEALRDVYIHHYKEIPNCNPSSGAHFDGTNTSFKLKHYPVADINGDGVVTGNNTSCATDVEVWWINNAGSYQRGVVTMNKHQSGEITITQEDGSTAIPSDNEGVWVEYWEQYKNYDEDIFRNAVGHLAADYLIRRLKETDRVTLADLQTNMPVIEMNPRRFYQKYKSIINRVRKPRMDAFK